MSNSHPLVQIDKLQCKAAFNQAAPRYDEYAVLQREVGSRLFERLDLMKLLPKTILDIGAGTGTCSSVLRKRYTNANVIALDMAVAMLLQAKHNCNWFVKNISRKQLFVCGDAEAIPLADNSVDLLFSNLTLQWCSNLDDVFSEFRRVLKPGAALLFSTLGPDTLKELRSAWAHADSNIHIHDFIDMHDVGDAMLRSGLVDPVMDMETITLTFSTATQLMKELKFLGAHNASRDRSPGLTGKKRLQTVIESYEKFRVNGKLPATYEVVYGHAWIAENTQAPNPNSIVVAPPRRNRR